MVSNKNRGKSRRGRTERYFVVETALGVQQLLNGEK